MTTHRPKPPSFSKVAKLGSWSKKMRIILKPMKNSFPIFKILFFWDKVNFILKVHRKLTKMSSYMTKLLSYIRFGNDYIKLRSRIFQENEYGFEKIKLSEMVRQKYLFLCLEIDWTVCKKIFIKIRAKKSS